MTNLTSDRAARHLRLIGRMAFAVGLTALGFVVFGTADARAGSRASFNGETATQIAALEVRARLVDTDDLADERAKGATAGALSTPDGSDSVAVILWDDAWSELQRRARLGSVSTTGANANSSLAGSSGGQLR